MRYTYRGEEDEIIPDEATHITMGEDVTFVRAQAFARHPNIIEVICKRVVKIEEEAFRDCPNLRRVIMPGVKIVEEKAFNSAVIIIISSAPLTDVECGKLETIGQAAFGCCGSLRSISLPSARIVGEYAFNTCRALVDAKFGSNLERFEEGAFAGCTSLERIIIPLKDGLFTTDDTFQACENLNQVHLLEGEVHETIAALQLEEWRNDMNRVIDSINRILPNALAGRWGDDGENAQAIRRWIRAVLRKIIHYQAEHQHVLDMAATTLKLALPHDIVNRSVIPFLELPSHTFELAEGGDEDEDEVSYSEGSSSEEESSSEEDSSSEGSSSDGSSSDGSSPGGSSDGSSSESSEEEEFSEEEESGMEEESSSDDEVPSKRQRIQDR
jgi:uncharacterized membrane protein YgcG